MAPRCWERAPSTTSNSLAARKVQRKLSNGVAGFCRRRIIFWSGLKEIAVRRVTTLSELVSEVDNQRQHTNLSSALRLFVLDFYRGQNSKMESDEQTPEMTVRPVS